MGTHGQINKTNNMVFTAPATSLNYQEVTGTNGTFCLGYITNGWNQDVGNALGSAIHALLPEYEGFTYGSYGGQNCSQMGYPKAVAQEDYDGRTWTLHSK